MQPITPSAVANSADFLRAITYGGALPNTTGSRDGGGGSGNTVQSAPTRTLCITSGSLEEIFWEINSCTLPTIFDLGGRTVYHNHDACNIVLTASNVTVQNGVIHHSDGNTSDDPGLHVQGANVRLTSLMFVGGGWGVLILPNASAKILNCIVQGCCFGLGVGDFGGSGLWGFATVEVENVKISKCANRGLSVGPSGAARVKKSEIFDNDNHGMQVCGNINSLLVASEVHCHGNKKRGLCVSSHGSVTLYRCNLTHNTNGSVYVESKQGIVKHDQCLLDEQAQAVQGGVLIAVSIF